MKSTVTHEDMMRYQDYVIFVEGKKDASSLKALGFSRVEIIHLPSVPLRERLLQLSSQISRKDKVCILTDFDKKGKQLYLLIKSLCSELGIKTDSTLRGLLLKARISHIEGLAHFLHE